MNKIILIGRTGKAPEIKNLESGKVAKFTLAVSEKITRGGEKVEETEWFNLAVFGKLADVCETYIKKGDKILAIGRYKTREYEDKTGAKRTFSEIIVSEIEMLGEKKDPKEQKREASYTAQAPDGPPPEVDDLPF